MNLTIHIILRPHPKLLDQTLKSISKLNSKILIANLQDDPEFPDKCRQYNAHIRKYLWRNDLSEIRNLMLQESTTDWNLYVEPWEVLMDEGDLELIVQDSPRVYQTSILTEESLRKEVRLWHKNSGCQFVNPVYERLDASDPSYSSLLIWENKIDRSKELDTLLGHWEKSQPFSQDMKYFKALQVLTNGDDQQFIRLANQYLFQPETKRIAATMLRYYLGLVHYIRLNLPEATHNAIKCIAANPLMAEFWCLLGDIFFKAKDSGRAMYFYDNAKKLGARRLYKDPWPMHIPKYDDYPSKMIGECQKSNSLTTTVI